MFRGFFDEGRPGKWKRPDFGFLGSLKRISCSGTKFMRRHPEAALFFLAFSKRDREKGPFKNILAYADRLCQPSCSFQAERQREDEVKKADKAK